MPPSSITWPVVAYAFVREMPYTLMIAAGAIVAVEFVVRSPGSSLEPLAAVIGPAIVTALGRSRPVEGAGGLMTAVGLLLRAKLGGG